jgi:hypothetical protein
VLLDWRNVVAEGRNRKRELMRLISRRQFVLSGAAVMGMRLAWAQTAQVLPAGLPRGVAAL